MRQGQAQLRTSTQQAPRGATRLAEVRPDLHPHESTFAWRNALLPCPEHKIPTYLLKKKKRYRIFYLKKDEKQKGQLKKSLSFFEKAHFLIVNYH